MTRRFIRKVLLLSLPVSVFLAGYTATTNLSTNPIDSSSTSVMAAPYHQHDDGLMDVHDKFLNFATLQDKKGQPLMSFEDVVRSLMQLPRQPSDKAAEVPELSDLLSVLDSDGDSRLSYGEYQVLFALLTTPPRLFERAFFMFDLNGNARLHADEFAELLPSLISIGENSAGRTKSTGNVHPVQNALGILQFLFGPELSNELDRKTFTAKVRSLREAVWRAECLILLADSGKDRKILRPKDVRRLFPKIQQQLRKNQQQPKSQRQQRHLSTDAFVNLMAVLQQSDLWIPALQLRLRAHGSDAATPKDVQCALRLLSQSTTDAVSLLFDIFDVDRSGTLSPDELKEISRSASHFFAKKVPSFAEPPRNSLQNFMYCMEQRDI